MLAGAGRRLCRAGARIRGEFRLAVRGRRQRAQRSARCVRPQRRRDLRGRRGALLAPVASRRIVGPPRRIDDPERAIVIIHSHGSLPTREIDPCEMDRVNAPYGVPFVINDLEGAAIAGRRVVVDGFCTPTRIGPMDPNTGLRTPKVIPRMREIAARAAAYVAAGVPPGQIFLSGHSAGGWASLLVERERPELIAGVIAFAPAAFGVAATRPPLVEAVRRRRFAELAGAPALRALVFGFAGDSFESTDELQAFGRVPGVDFVALPADAIDGRRCSFAAHQRLRDPCFAETQAERIRAFIADRLAAP